jgi:hypothetical protein
VTGIPKRLPSLEILLTNTDKHLSILSKYSHWCFHCLLKSESPWHQLLYENKI